MQTRVNLKTVPLFCAVLASPTTSRLFAQVGEQLPVWTTVSPQLYQAAAPAPNQTKQLTAPYTYYFPGVLTQYEASPYGCTYNNFFEPGYPYNSAPPWVYSGGVLETGPIYLGQPAVQSSYYASPPNTGLEFRGVQFDATFAMTSSSNTSTEVAGLYYYATLCSFGGPEYGFQITYSSNSIQPGFYFDQGCSTGCYENEGNPPTGASEYCTGGVTLPALTKNSLGTYEYYYSAWVYKQTEAPQHWVIAGAVQDPGTYATTWECVADPLNNVSNGQPTFQNAPGYSLCKQAYTQNYNCGKNAKGAWNPVVAFPYLGGSDVYEPDPTAPDWTLLDYWFGTVNMGVVNATNSTDADEGKVALTVKRIVVGK